MRPSLIYARNDFPRYLNRNQLPPPEIGFKLEILNFANEEHGSAPYPEADKFPMQPGKPSFPSGGVNTLSGSSTTPLTDYGDYDNFGSGVEDEEHTPNSLKEMRIIIPSRPYRGDEDLHFLPQNVVRIQERRHQPVVDGRENRSRIPSVHHHTRASRKVKENLHDRSGDGFCQYNG